MAEFANLLEVLNLLDKSNCRKCGEKTCMAFAAAVFTGKRQLYECPTVAKEDVDRYGHQERKRNKIEEDNEKIINQLKEQLPAIDFPKRAAEIDAICRNGRITLKIMGKDFSLDQQGNAYTDIHVNPWILIAALNYINFSRARALTGNWVPLRELPSGRDWYRLFGQQCEKVLKKTADTYSDLFSDLVRLFSGRQIEDQFKSDVAVVLSPLPLVPMLICYWKAEEGMESALGLFFDDTGEDYLGIEGLYGLGVGFASMLEKLARRHGHLIR
jgi:hypothetical protein